MARRPFIPQAGPRFQEFDFNSTVPDIKEGAVVLLDASEEIVEAGADPASILGVIAHRTKMFDGGDRDLLPLKGTVALAGPGKLFIGELGDAAGVKLIPAQTDINQEYGVTEDAAGFWYVDQSKTGAAARVHIENIDTELDLVIFYFLEANLQMNN